MYIDDSKKERIEHVRRPDLPWRASDRTECGLVVDGHPVITREVFLQKVKAQGQQRSAMTTCMTCWNTAQRHPSWEQDPVQALRREIEGAYRKEPKLRFHRELVALSILASRHRDEFDELIKDQEETVPLQSRRADR